MSKKINDLPLGNAVSDSTLIPTWNNSRTERITGGQFKEYIDAYVDSTLDLSNVTQNVLPDADNAYDLGSPTKQWRDIFVSNGSVYIGDIKLSNDSGTLKVQQVTDAGTVDEEPIPNSPGSVTTDKLVNGEHTLILLDDGTLELDGDSVLGGGGTFNQSLNTGDSVTFDSVGATTVNVSQINGTNPGDELVIQANNHNWTFSTDGNLTFPQGTLLGYSDPGGFIIDGAVDKDIAIYTYSGADAHGWTFGTDGSLTLPAGGDIVDSNGDSVLGGGSYTPDDSDNWDSPTVNTVAAALDELAARVTALQNFEIDGGNANTPALGELLIDGNGA
jgi:hypothetical protein